MDLKSPNKKSIMGTSDPSNNPHCTQIYLTKRKIKITNMVKKKKSLTKMTSLQFSAGGTQTHTIQQYSGASTRVGHV